jgi:hypothetical protein
VIDEYHWVSPTRVIYTIAQRQRDNVTPTPTGEIFAIDRDGGPHASSTAIRAGQSTLDTHMQTRQASYCDASPAAGAAKGSESRADCRVSVA